MADDKILTSFLDQNPAQVVPDTQEFLNKKRLLVEKILKTFINLLPSNYVSETVGPHYMVQFQAIAEQLAILQITLQEELKDLDFDFTRSEFLYQFLGSLVFPDTTETGYPNIDGDISFREFLAKMVGLLVQGATFDSVLAGLKLLTDADIEIIEKAIAARETENSAWGFDEQFEFEINVSVNGGTDFPPNPFILQDNAVIVLRALKPAHTFFDYRHLFRDAFGPIFEDTLSWDLDTHYFDDFRKYCDGAKEIRGGERKTFGGAGSGTVATDIFEDLTADFITSQVRAGSVLVLVTGAVIAALEVVQVLDATHLQILPAFTGTFSSADWLVLTSSGGDTLTDRRLFSDPNRDFTSIRPGAVLTILPVTEGASGSVTVDSTTFTDATTNFVAFGVAAQDSLKIAVGTNAGTKTVASITDDQNFETTIAFTATEASLGWQVLAPNSGQYRVDEILTVPVPEDPVARTYTTFPTGLTGDLVVTAGNFVDVTTVPVDFALAVSGEILVLSDGPNTGSYRLKTLVGNGGGPVGDSPGPATEVIPAPSLLRIDRRMPESAEGQPYSVTVDRLGVRRPKEVLGEDVSGFFVI